MDINKVYHGNALTVLKSFPDECIDMCMTSPPYWGLRSYDTEPEIWDGADNCEHDWVYNDTKKVSLSGPGSLIYDHYISEKAPEISFCGKCGAFKGELGSEPDPDLFIKHLLSIFSEVKRVLKPEGSCYVNLGDSYINERTYAPVGERKLKRKSLAAVPCRFVLGMLDMGFIFRNGVIWHKSNGMPTSAKDRYTVDWEPLFFFTKNPEYYFNQQFEPLKDVSIERLKHNFNGGKGELQSAVKVSGINSYKEKYLKGEVDGANKRCVWTLATASSSEEHYAMYPEALCVTPIKASCPGGGIVLDPFSGSGTTLRTAVTLGRNYVGIDINRKFADMSDRKGRQAPPTLFTID